MESTTRSMAATLLREARQRSGLSQAELARRARVAPSVISTYESGRTQPALPMLARLPHRQSSRSTSVDSNHQTGQTPPPSPKGPGFRAQILR